MELREMLERYKNKVYVYKVNIESLSEAENIVKDFKDALEGKKIILYGAGTVGRVFYQLLKELGFTVELLLDRAGEDVVFPDNRRVYKPDYLVEQKLDLNEYQIIATVNRNLYQDVVAMLDKFGVSSDKIVCGHDIHMLVQNAWCRLKANGSDRMILKNCYECTNLDNTCSSLNQYLKRVNGFVDEGKGTKAVRMIGYALGNICTLKCKNCCESVPYMPSHIKKFTPKENVIKDIQHLSSACNFLTLLEFIGGEPFLHPHLDEILSEILKIKNIGVIHIFTNGTVLPSDSLCEVLKNERITVYISNYQATLSDKFLEAIAATDNKLKKYGVNSFFGKKQNWMDFSGYNKVNEDYELEEVFEACFLHNCNRLQDGTLYVCAHQYAGIMLGKLEDNGEILKIHQYSTEELSKELERFKAYKTIDACRYCTMPFKAETVMSGEQLD